jgi:hypothetical protein
MATFNDLFGQQMNVQEQPAMEQPATKGKTFADLFGQQMNVQEQPVIQEPETVTSDELFPEEEERSAGIKDYARAAGQGLTFGLGDEAEAGYKAAISKLREIHPALGSIVDALPKAITLPLVTPYGMTTPQYDENVKEIRDELSAARESDPLKMMGAEIAGGLITGGAGGAKVLASKGVQKTGDVMGKMAAAIPNVIAKQAPGGKHISNTLDSIASGVAKLGILGGGESALYGVGTGEDAEDRLNRGISLGIEGAAIGGILGAPGQMISRGIGALPKTNYKIIPGIYEDVTTLPLESITHRGPSKKDIGSFLLTGDPTRIIKLPEADKSITFKMANDVLGNLGAFGVAGASPYVHSDANRDYNK